MYRHFKHFTTAKALAFHFFIASLLAATLIGCASTSPEGPECEQWDWFELGRRDGASGKTEKQSGQLFEQCSLPQDSPLVEAFKNGRNAGLVDYCAPSNGFTLGQSNETYNYVCPRNLQAAFLSEYRRGQKVRTLEVANQEITNRIRRITQRLSGQVESDQEELLKSQLAQLKRFQKENQEELQSLEN